MTFASTSQHQILIVGASVRAAAQSAAAAGHKVAAIDLFGDRDLRAIATWQPANHYPRGLAAAAARVGTMDWMYTGALENHPSVLQAIQSRHRLLGNDPDVIGRVRDPFLLADRATTAGFRVPQLADRAPRPPDHWLIKPRRSAAGKGIEWATGDRRPGHYFQSFVAGQSVSLTAVAGSSSCRLLGVCEQLVGCEWTGARPFAYCGSIGPLYLSPDIWDAATELVNFIAGEFELCGIFGVDAIVNEQGLWLIEVNPRFTASMEIVQSVTGVNMIETHVAACRGLPLPPAKEPREGLFGKAILFAKYNRRIDEQQIDDWWDARIDNVGRLRYADIPNQPQWISTGQPVLTVFSQGSNRDNLIDELKKTAHEHS